jgi:hypothetical protein
MTKKGLNAVVDIMRNVMENCQKEVSVKAFWIFAHEEEELLIDLVNDGIEPEQIYESILQRQKNEYNLTRWL